MNWMTVAFAGYFFSAIASVVDKSLLSEKRIGAPALYAFFVSLMNLPFLAIIPFGFVRFTPSAVAIGIVAGVLYLFGLLMMYYAIKQSEVSRAAPLVGASAIAFLFLFSVTSALVAGKHISFLHVFAIALLAGGATLLSAGKRGVHDSRFVLSVLVAGAFQAGSLILLRQSYLASNFITGLIWSKFGIFLAGLSLFLVPSFRESILSGHGRFSKPEHKTAGTAGFFAFNQVFGGLGALLVSYAVSLGPATFVQGMGGVQFGLVFVFAMLLSARYPATFEERVSRRETIRKTVAIALLSLGIWLVALGGDLAGFL
ncbi:MAG TPA: hypothetical protein VN420_03595 [Candidatus Fimivivens sp.]|nr:hypothetical protein [Candidatus Fimivivens sp.]